LARKGNLILGNLATFLWITQAHDEGGSLDLGIQFHRNGFWAQLRVHGLTFLFPSIFSATNVQLWVC
jgi:hypothetical protein